MEAIEAGAEKTLATLVYRGEKPATTLRLMCQNIFVHISILRKRAVY